MSRAKLAKVAAAATAGVVVVSAGFVGASLFTDVSESSPVSFATCEQSVSEALLSNRIVATSQSYRKDNPAEYTRVRAYLDGGVRPTGSLTHMGLHLVALEDTCRDFTTTTTTTTTQPTTTTTTTTQPTTTTTTTDTTTTTTTTPVGCAVTTPNVPDGPDGMGGCFPGAANTGVPAGTTLTAYTGPCTITVANTVIDSKSITCNRISISTTGVVIRNSTIKIGVRGVGAASFTIQDSLIDGLTNGYACIDCGVDGRNFTILRTEIINTNRGAYCDNNCLIKDSWVHGTTLNPSSGAHASGVREQQYGTLTHNTLACDYSTPSGETGCSADLTGYPDFAPIHHNTVESNLFIANNGGNSFCAYGGGTSGKPYSNDPLNATYQVFRNNVFQRGPNGKCGAYGAITDFISGRTGNVWTNNKFDNGTTVTP